MLRKLLDLWKKDSLIRSAYEDTNLMLSKTNYMFVSVSGLFLNDSPLEFDVYAMDKEINKLEIGVRRKVLQHLSINPEQELLASLVLTTIITDIERIGDYSKNIYELRELYEVCKDLPPYSDILLGTTGTVSDMFKMTIEVIKNEAHQMAQKTMEMHGQVNHTMEQMMWALGNDPNMQAPKAVPLALYARYLKRVSAHLSNVTSSVNRPFDRIGYFHLENGETTEEKDIDDLSEKD